MNDKKNNDLQSILYPISSFLREMDLDIKKYLTSNIPLLDESSTHLFWGGGKKIRAALVICASGLKGSVPSGIIPIASAAEIVHAATLIHDDIIDQSLLRRGNVSVPAKWGNKVSVLVGDYMYTLALSLVVDDSCDGLFPVMVLGAREMVTGELYQLQYSTIDVVNRQHYYKIIELKTAIFMGCCAKLGAIKSGFSADEQEKIYNFGYNLGYAFQIVDDTLDYAETEITGKESGNDFFTGKITLPYIYLLEQADEKEREELVQYANNPSTDNWQYIKQMIIEKDVLTYSYNVSAAYIETALEYLKEFPESEYRDVLYELSLFLKNRPY